MTSFPELLEWISVATAIVYVFLAAKGKKSCFIFGFISSAIFVHICFTDHLYFDTIINVYYVVMSVVGWIQWSGSKDHIQVGKIPKKQFLLLTSSAVILSVILGYLVDNYTDATLAYVDSLTTMLAVLATWLMVKKVLQNWLIWIVADAVSILMYAYKDHFPIALLFFIYTVLAVYGWYQWKKLIPSKI